MDDVPASYSACIRTLVETASSQTTFSDEHEKLIAKYTPFYYRYLTEEDIDELTSFFETRIGRKFIEVSPKLCADIITEFIQSGGLASFLRSGKLSSEPSEQP